MFSDEDVRMKELESRWETQMPKEKPFIIRLDGVNFRRFTKQSCFEKPFSSLFADVMEATAEALLRKFTPISVYTSSDEISMIFPAISQERLEITERIYNGRVQKLASVTASYASVIFNKTLQNTVPQCDLATFDARVFSVDDEETVAANILWRSNRDAARNSYSRLAQFYLGKVAVQKMSKDEVREGLKNKNVIWDELESRFKYGVIIKKRLASVRIANWKTGELEDAFRTEITKMPITRDLTVDKIAFQNLLFSSDKKID